MVDSNSISMMCTTIAENLSLADNSSDSLAAADLDDPSNAKDDSQDSGTEDPTELDEEDSADEEEGLAVQLPHHLAAESPGAAAATAACNVNDDLLSHNVYLSGPPAVVLTSGAAALNPGVIMSAPLRRRVRDLSSYKDESSPDKLGSIVRDLPLEVLLQVFGNLDDMGLYIVSNVCTKWSELIESEVSNEQWELYVKRRWPLFKPHYHVDSWKDIHARLIASAPCQYCIENMKVNNMNSSSEMNAKPPIRQRRLTSERRTLEMDPPEGILAVPLDSKCSYWQAVITGPKATPYESGRFYLYLVIPSSYPLHPPIVKFITKIFHPNVSRHGDIGLDCILHNWSLALTLSKILLSIQSLLTDPYLNVCMEPEIARCYKEDRGLYDRIAKQWTWRYAMTERQQVLFGVIDEADGFLPFTSQSI